MKTNVGLQRLKDTVKLYEGFIKDGKASEEGYGHLIIRLNELIGMVEKGITASEFDSLSHREKWDVSACIKTVFACPDCLTVSKPKRAFMGSIECENCEHTLTFRTNGGQSDPFNWIVQIGHELPVLSTMTTIDTKAAKLFIDLMDTRIALTNNPHHREELQEIRNEAAVLLGMDVATELDKLKEKLNNGK